ncbi:sodium- and chloride-dependent GABA transporter 1 isoform X2 [Nematostella vectensis]|nr:sodium- and chloride-dependent GABA transporter 1 isoform X2 [Nematostella vectensis]XP_032222490.1 sodium- and chloride-dependent GABA transporter 1 isoform X2 [Nematostella vectensis]
MAEPDEKTKIAVNGDADGEGLTSDENCKIDVEIIGEEREKWGRKVEFFLACVGYAVGLGNVWRFPYLCFKNGGGAFLIPYLCMLLICGMPLFFMELSLGQFVSLGPVTSWAAICPISKGVGFAMLVVSFLCCVYYNVIIAWCLYYLFESFAKDVPWKTCDNWWNTATCLRGRAPSPTSANSTNSTMCSAITSAATSLANATSNCTSNLTDTALKEYSSPSKEFYENYVLRITPDIDTFGVMRWQLVVCLILAWVLVYFCLWKGIKSSGKVVYFTATFPYLVLVILLIRGLTLPGAMKGLSFYLKPNFSKLGDAIVWVDAATQIFYSLGIGFGSLIAMGSYNKFHNNCFRDAMTVSVINCSTSVFAGLVIFSVLGFMAEVLGKEVSEVATSGPGLAFVVYPEGIAQMPISPFWSICFFFMLLTLGLDTQFAMFEAVTTGLGDEYVRLLRNRKELFTAFLCFCCFLLGLPIVSQSGAFIMNLYVWQAGGVSLVFLAFFEVIVVAWGYGADRFALDIETMTGNKVWPWWPIAWKYITPAVITGIFIFSLVQWQGVSYDDYQYPPWAEFVGWVMALSSMLWIPGVAIYKMSRAKGTFMERWRSLTRPDQEQMSIIELREGIPKRPDVVSL